MPKETRCEDVFVWNVDLRRGASVSYENLCRLVLTMKIEYFSWRKRLCENERFGTSLFWRLIGSRLIEKLIVFPRIFIAVFILTEICSLLTCLKYLPFLPGKNGVVRHCVVRNLCFWSLCCYWGYKRKTCREMHDMSAIWTFFYAHEIGWLDWLPYRWSYMHCLSVFLQPWLVTIWELRTCASRGSFLYCYKNLWSDLLNQTDCRKELGTFSSGEHLEIFHSKSGIGSIGVIKTELVRRQQVRYEECESCDSLLFFSSSLLCYFHFFSLLP